METTVRAICHKEGIPAKTIEALTGGQVNQVFLVDGAIVVRIGGREDAFERLQRETQLIRRFEGKIAVPKIYAFGVYEGQVYQIQQYLSGKKLYGVWKDCAPEVQESIVADLAAQLKVVHSTRCDYFSDGPGESRRFSTWPDLVAHNFKSTLAEIEALHIRMVPGFVEMATGYFEEHRHVLEGGVPVLVHGDVSLVNLLVDGGMLTALLDFEYAVQAPLDYELCVMEEFCVYPNDYAEENQEIYCTADFASFIPLLRKHYPALFDVPHLRERLNLYHLGAALSCYLAWRKSNLETIPPERMAAKEFYMARITNFIFRNGVKMFFA